MLDGLPIAELAAKGGPWGLVSLFVLFVLTGRLLTRKAHEDRVGDLKERITSLEATLATRDAELAVKGRQLSRLLGSTDMQVQVLQSLAREAGHDPVVE